MKNDTKKILTTSLSELIGKYEKSNVLAELEREYLSLPTKQLNISLIKRNKFLKRVYFSDEKITQLISIYGQTIFLEPLICREVDGKFEIIIGHEKYLAAKLLNVLTLKVIITNYTDEETLLILLAIAREREQKNMVELAVLFAALTKDFNYKQEQIATLSYLSRPQVTNILRLLKLPKNILQKVQAGKITYGHARALIKCDQDKQEHIVSLIVNEKLTVRELEKMLSAKRGGEKPLKKHTILQTGRKVVVIFTNEEEAALFAAKTKKDIS